MSDDTKPADDVCPTCGGEGGLLNRQIDGSIRPQKCPNYACVNGRVPREPEQENARLTARVAELQADADRMRNHYSRYDAKACPFCIYENGRFIRNCKLHDEIDELRQRAEAAEAELAELKKWQQDQRERAGGIEPEFEIERLHSTLYRIEAELAALKAKVEAAGKIFYAELFAFAGNEDKQHGWNIARAQFRAALGLEAQ